MKKYLFLCVLLIAWFAQTSSAQLQVGKPFTQKKANMIMTHVSGKFVLVPVDSIKSFAPVSDTAFLTKVKKSACEHFKTFIPTLVLKAERISDKTANLQWETKYAFYAKGFNIERSFEDTLHFMPVNFAAVSRATNFKKEYHLPDYNDYNRISFYRIKQLNGDTGFAYSNIVSINGYDAIVLSIYPTPATDKVWVKVLAKESGNSTISVYDGTGKIVQQQSASCIKNTNIAESINISKLATGIYQLKILMPDKSLLTGRFIKSR